MNNKCLKYYNANELIIDDKNNLINVFKIADKRSMTN